MSEQKTVGLVVAGAAARGAYEAGVLSVLIPELDRRGKRPTVLVGSSAGGINAFLLAQYSDLNAAEAVQKIVDVWAQIELSNILRNILPTAVGNGILSLAEFLGVPGVRLKWLFDTAPLRTTVEQLFDADRLHHNIQEGRVRALALAATAANGRTKVFVESTAGVPLPPTDDDRALDYIATKLEPAHVLASAAIPILFPPILVETPKEARGWYRDGLVRLNAPIKPAIALDAKQLALVSSDSDTYSSEKEFKKKEKESPDISDAGSQLLHAVLTDHMVEDIRTLRKVNRLVDGSQKGCDLRLMSVDTADGLVNEGRNLIIVALVGTNLHIRIFDATGKRVVDKAENELITGKMLTTLKKQLNPLPEESCLSPEQKQKIIRDATLIAGHTSQKNSGGSYQRIDHIFAGPCKAGLLGKAADEYYIDHYGKGWKFLSPFTLLGRLLGNNSQSRGELLSWLLFEPEFMKKIIKMGQNDAEQRLKAARDFKDFPFNEGD